MDTVGLSLASLEIGKLEACLELMFLAARADGAVNEAERAEFKAHVLEQTRGELVPELVEQLMAAIEKNIAREPRELRLEAIRARIPDERTRKAAMRLAAQIVLADGRLDVDEVEFLERAAEVLDLDPRICRELLPHE